MTLQQDYHATVGNWREQLKRNERKTRYVICSFLFIYSAIGILVDVVALSEMRPEMVLNQIFWALLSFKAIPYATIIMFGFAALSLLITYSLYDTIMLLGTDYREITPETAKTLQEKKFYNVVEEMKVAAGLSFMPKVYVIEADYMNAFASGYSEKSAMVAITRGLMEKLDRSELQAVMAHELSHIRHHDIKLTLTVAVLSNIMLIVLDILFYAVFYGRYNNNKKDEVQILLIIIRLLRFLLPLITAVLALFLSRTREYMADSGAVELMRDNEPMARALLKIENDHQANASQYAKEYGNTAHEQVRHSSYLFDPSRIDPVKSIFNLFSTHPSIEKRLRAIGFLKKKNDNV